MTRALEAAARVRGRTAPNPWVGAAVLSDPDGARRWFAGATAPPGGDHAEINALRAAGGGAESGTLYVTLEPCAHLGRTPPCAAAIIESGVRRVVVAIEDPDPLVNGRGIAALRSAGLEVEVGVEREAATEQLAGYLKHRRTGRPWVVLKLAATLDGRIAAPDGTSRWITGDSARSDAHRLRARADAVLVGAGTVRADDPALTVRLPAGDPDFRGPDEQPIRVVLGRVPAGAAVAPAWELSGDPGRVLDELGRRGVLEVLVEGGATVAHAFHSSRLVDRYVLYLAPALFGGDDARPLFAGPGAPTLEDVWRGRVHSVTSLGSDLRVELSPSTS
ncbi:MAG TPA: bifunctional diaminohydroxyphosphoribosylaminopyrimidine deaminase/5-amino-6-(5-phosphoribosylamino)uracil reductase RibD [Acidimicrobiales bacterium]|jgi:diaminohydroxyphosphoribosylaminopyrimidine deaminase/5-amino-6-(5-phosphoribosylamino)uracil reductase|nr:bifunctional diaminohydroxyphosphoribosylaminopyrimidine deaminase/5-amino-6-(5-phosphoribosylamino)uracil reductase RibD [Acidimicrobiales bacterium]